MSRPKLLEPSRLAPVEVNLRTALLVLMVLWFVGGVVAAVLAAQGHIAVDAVWVCATGLSLGGVGLVWEARRRR